MEIGMTKQEAIIYICDHLSEAAIMEQAAEEAAEAAQAYSKWARVERGENPTPVSWEAAMEGAEDEYQDLENVRIVLSVKLDPFVLDEIKGVLDYLVNDKIIRWAERIKERENANE